MHRGSVLLITFESMKTIIFYFIITAFFLNLPASLSAGNTLTKKSDIPIQFPNISGEMGDARGDTYFLSLENQSPDTLPSHEETDVKKLADADSIPSKIEPLPILSYDSNTGFGFGAKAFFLNLLKLRESFDLIIFFSTKGERSLRFDFSLPDF